MQSRSRHRGLLVAGRTVEENSQLKKVLTICDAKSLYDHLSSETSGIASDRRTAIEMQIIRASLDAQDGEIRWVDHTGMYADALTKKNGNIPLIQILMRTARVCITEHSAIMEKHRLDPKARSSHSKTHLDPALADGGTPISVAASTESDPSTPIRHEDGKRRVDSSPASSYKHAHRKKAEKRTRFPPSSKT